jgi:hypothetical protein
VFALEFDVQPQIEDPGLIFASATVRRRLWPCPDKWESLTDGELVALLNGARAIL